MNHRDFPAVRDAVATESMLQRGEDLWPVRAALWTQYVDLRDQLAEAKRAGNRKRTETLEYELYNPPSGEYGDKGGIAHQWAATDAEIADIMRDERYIRWAEAQRRTA